MLIKAKTKAGLGIQYSLTDTQDLIVEKGVSLRSTDSFGVFGEGANQKVTVEGLIIGMDDPIRLEGANAQVLVAAGGRVLGSNDDGIDLSGANSLITNRGTIQGYYGTYQHFDGVGKATLINHGTLIGREDAVNFNLDAGSKTMLKNFGIITAGTDDALETYDSDDTVINQGTMWGDVELGSGKDVYDGRGGTLIGTVNGADGDDLFRAGAGIERFDGGNDFDTLEFRTAKAVTVDLDDNSLNKGWAKGDSYFGIDGLVGSATGADKLYGHGGENRLVGLGGNDLLDGRDGADTLVGGAGQDTLTGGGGTDIFRYNALTDGGDVVTDFDPFMDTFEFARSVFKGLDLAGVLPSEQFLSGTTNKATTAAHRIIYNEDNGKIWYDRDGSGTKFKGVLIATVTVGTELSNGDFLFV
jgi:Ca2+-binding RTX toxin-like protein